jgi:hypothetical protein
VSAHEPPTLIFMHVPKTAGRSLEALLERHVPAAQTWDGYGDRAGREAAFEALRQLPEAQRRNLRLVKGHFPFGIHEHLPQESEYLVFFRDPVDRVISLYHYILRDATHRLHDALVQRSMSLDAFVRSDLLPAAFCNAQTRLLAGRSIGDDAPCGEQVWAQARANLDRHFGVVGLMERFEESVAVLGARYGWRRLHVPMRNVSSRRRAAELSESTLALLLEKNELDLRLHRLAEHRLEAQRLAHGAQAERALRRLRRRQRVGRAWDGLRRLGAGAGAG